MNIDQPIYELFKLGRTGLQKETGDIGIEVEVEGLDLPARVAGGRWHVKNDGSLRAPVGGSAYEYVTVGAIPYADVDAVLAELKTAMAKAKPQWSNRTSVHIHVNVSDMSFRDTINFMALYTTFEDILTEYAGGLKRSGNLFCVRAVDAEENIDTIVRSIRDQAIDAFYDDNLHYAGMNVNSITQRGSIEFRAMAGNLDTKFIKSWIDALYGLREKAKTFNDPREVVSALSHTGPIQFMRDCLPVDVATQCRMQPELFPRLFDGVRLAQELAYAREWGLRAPYKAKASKAKIVMDEYAQFIIPGGEIVRRDPAPPPIRWGFDAPIAPAPVRPARRVVRARNG